MLCLLLFVSWANCDCPSHPNQQPLIDFQPELLKDIPNGQLYKLGTDNKNTILIAKLKGSAYQMGYAYGSLFKDELPDQMNIFYNYLREELEDVLHIPDSFKKAISGSAEVLLKKVLWLNTLITRKYTNKRLFQEVKGISRASGVPEKQILELNIFPELIKAACSVIGLWGPATKQNHTLHMRSLDWDRNFPINKYPLITVYHSTQANSKKYANIGYLGLIGMLTGISEKLSIGEKVWIPPKGSVSTTRYGEPWTYVLRNVVQFADDLPSANQILRTSHRTCSIHLGLASNIDHAFTMDLYAYKQLVVYDDKNYTYTKAHPKKEGVAYFDKHVQPSGNQCVGKYLLEDYGNWTMPDLWRKVGLSHETGDTQLVVFDLEEMVGYVSYSEHGTGVEAYKRSPMLVDFKILFEDF